MILIPMEVTSSCCGARTHHVYGWVFIIWFTSSVSIFGLELQTISQVVTRCGENVTLTCETTAQHAEIKSFAWVDKNINSQNADCSGTGVVCESTAKTPKCSCNLTLLNVMPVNQGDYLCKLHSNLGIKSAKTVVIVQDCFEEPVFSISESHAKCCYSGVYPSGMIHWLQEGSGLVSASGEDQEEDQYGRLKVCSTIDVRKRSLSQSYNCSLWIPSVAKYYSSKELPNASGSMAKLQGIIIMAEIMLVKFMS